jgi:hypothetical protein
LQWFLYKHLRNHTIELDAIQSIAVFGLWDQPRTILTWNDIVERNFSWCFMRQQLGLTAAQLKKIQPEKREWIQRINLTLHDLPDMCVFPVNPFEDLGADLAEVWSMRWSIATLARMGVTYEQMKQRGLSPQMMSYFQIPLTGWIDLKFGVSHVEALSCVEIQNIFGVEKEELLSVMSSTLVHESVT